MPLMAIIIRLTHSFEYRIMAVRLAALSAAAVCGYRFGLLLLSPCQVQCPVACPLNAPLPSLMPPSMPPSISSITLPGPRLLFLVSSFVGLLLGLPLGLPLALPLDRCQ